MTKKDTENAFPDVAGLMAERQQYEAWLAALDAKRDSTPRHVFQRVRADYETRLRRVLEQLSSHRSELEERLGQLTKRVTELETEERARRDEREELELRSTVGELSREAYQKAAADCDRQIAEISALHTSVKEEAERTREFLGEANRPSPALQQDAVPATPAAAGTEARPAADAGEAAAPPSRGTPGASGAPVPPRGPNFDELAFLKTVVGDGASEPPPQRISSERPAVTEPEARPARPAPRPSKPQPRVARPEPEATPSAEASSAAARRSSKPDWIAEQQSETLDAAASGEPTIERDEPAPLAANISGNHPIVLRSSGQVDSAKTLKCAECGAMNYPTEWYCERCGAELAAL